MSRRTADPTYRRLRERLKAQRLPCHICEKPIDYDLPAADKDSFTADHVEPYATGGSNTGTLLAAHRGCNSRRGTQPLSDRTRSNEAHALPW